MSKEIVTIKIAVFKRKRYEKSYIKMNGGFRLLILLRY